MFSKATNLEKIFRDHSLRVPDFFNVEIQAFLKPTFEKSISERTVKKKYVLSFFCLHHCRHKVSKIFCDFREIGRHLRSKKYITILQYALVTFPDRLCAIFLKKFAKSKMFLIPSIFCKILPPLNVLQKKRLECTITRPKAARIDKQIKPRRDF